MRILLYLWAVPLCLFWGWYALSLYDVSFGTVILSRDLHDLVFRLYGQFLGVPAAKVPAMIAWGCVFDSTVIGAIAAWRWRDAWYPRAHAYVLARALPFVAVRAGPEGQGEIQQAEATSFTAALPSTVLPDGPARPAE